MSKEKDIYKGICEQCETCMNDCKNECVVEINCLNRVKCENMEYYWNLINEQNVDLKRFCNDYGLKYNYLMKMLNLKMIMPYKYHKCIQARLFEVEEFIPYVNKEEQ